MIFLVSQQRCRPRYQSQSSPATETREAHAGAAETAPAADGAGLGLSGTGHRGRQPVSEDSLASGSWEERSHRPEGVALASPGRLCRILSGQQRLRRCTSPLCRQNGYERWPWSLPKGAQPFAQRHRSHADQPDQTPFQRLGGQKTFRYAKTRPSDSSTAKSSPHRIRTPGS